jgi:hypothetical protein
LVELTGFPKKIQVGHPTSDAFGELNGELTFQSAFRRSTELGLRAILAAPS